MLNLALNDRVGSSGFSRDHGAKSNIFDLVQPGAAVVCNPDHPIVADEIDRNNFAREQALAARKDLVEDRIGVRNRAADGGENFTGSTLLLERLPRLVEQAHVIDGNRRLLRKRLHQRNLLGREQSGLAAPEEDCTVCVAFSYQRHGERGTNPEPPCV